MQVTTYGSHVLGIHAIPKALFVERTSSKTRSVGDATPALRELRTRVRYAIQNLGIDKSKIANFDVSFDPTLDVPITPGFDLPAAVAMLAAHEIVPKDRLEQTMFVGELALSGELRVIRGALASAVAAREAGTFTTLVVPYGNGNEAATVAGLTVLEMRNLTNVVDYLKGTFAPTPVVVDVAAALVPNDTADLSDVIGNEHAKLGLEIAAAGGHHVSLLGPPGTGKTLLARRLPGILPSMTFAEALSVTKVYSVAGLMREHEAVVANRPFRAPHHTISDAGLVGGGAHPRPGELSLAHNGVLMLDEVSEFKKYVVDVLRATLREGCATLRYRNLQVTFPIGALLVLADIPCPCGYLGSTVRECRCPADARASRAKRREGYAALADVHAHMTPPPPGGIPATTRREMSADVRARVEAARAIQQKRYARQTDHQRTNAWLTPKGASKHCVLDATGQALFDTGTASLSDPQKLSVLRVARTIADLQASEPITSDHVRTALTFAPPKEG